MIQGECDMDNEMDLKDVQVRLVQTYREVLGWIQQQRAEGSSEKDIEKNLLQLRGIDPKAVDQLLRGKLPKTVS